LPNKEERIRAIGLKDVEKKYKNAFIPDEEFFEPIPEPSAWDWLSSHHKKESKQTFEEYRNRHQIINKNQVYLLPLGVFPNVDFETIKDAYPSVPSITQIVEYAKAFFTLPVSLLPPLVLKEEGPNYYIFSWENQTF